MSVIEAQENGAKKNVKSVGGDHIDRQQDFYMDLPTYYLVVVVADVYVRMIVSATDHTVYPVAAVLW